ncbi:MAG: SLC13 family permease [Microvirga sp.]|nr:SLC13 family permease [Microvirga sp.]
MTQDQAIFLAILAATIAMFLLGRWRHDMVAVGSLLLCVFAGLVPAEQAFAGFGHPAVITVACVLVLSRALQVSGAVDAVARRVIPANAGFVVTLAALTLLAATLSAFMNNVGALALLMPVAIQVASRHGIPPGRVLMPVAFGSILGGMTTLIGTPPNLIVAGFRAETSGAGFVMFDFAPVGIAVAIAGLAFILLVGWRLVPERKQAGGEAFEIDAYMTEARVPKESKAVGKTLKELEVALDETDGLIVGMVRNDVRMTAPDPWRRLQEGDILVIEAEPNALASSLSSLGLVLEEDKPRKSDDEGEEEAAAENSKPARSEDDETALLELVVLPNSTLIGRSVADIRLRDRFAINMLAVSRQGRRSRARLRTLAISAGDVLLMQGSGQRLSDFAGQFGLVPLAERPLRIPNPREATLALGVMGAAVASAAFGLLSAAIAFAAGVLAVMALRLVPPRVVYTAVDWPVVVLLGALIPVAGAMATTGTADLIAQTLLEFAARGNAVVALTLILIVTMTLSDFMNNAATAAVMCPIAVGAARSLDVSADPFLMAVAVGASCAFLTPIGHQNNTLILGPGGFGFSDYWRLGLPLEIVVLAVAVPMLLIVWPM